MARWPKGRFPIRITRDSALFMVGLLGIGYETLVTNADRPTLLVLFGAMVGLPAFLRNDEKSAPPPPPPPPATPPAPVQPVQPEQPKVEDP